MVFNWTFAKLTITKQITITEVPCVAHYLIAMGGVSFHITGDRLGV